MKKLLTVMLCGMLVFGGSSLTARAASLDDVINNNSQVEQSVDSNSQTQSNNSSSSTSTSNGTSGGYVSSDNYINSLKDATDLTQSSEVVSKVNTSLKKVISIVVQILAYAITALLTVRVVLDLMFIAIPFSRKYLANGFMGNAQAGAQQPGMNGSMGAMGGGFGGMSGGYGGMSGGYGMGGGYGMNRGYGMNGGMGAMGGMNGGLGTPQQQPGMNGRTQWVSNAALNAVASAQAGVNPYSAYIKDMTVVCILTPILLILATTGALTNLGFLLGDVLARAIGSIGTMF